ncbi:carbohydrate ABC transporter permease [uncultured Robinsoniella sp.]|uniref:carbohydrate ABC transporter permease n=1 Tax=uncultured Robinsoniella sp. TaxID=904190 RepID=UPI00374F2A8C
MKNANRQPSRNRNLLLIGILILLALIFILPLYITVINIFKPTKIIAASPMSIPIPPILDNVVNVLKSPNVNLAQMYFNSICITVFGAGICILVSSMAAYYIVRTKNRVANFLSIFFLFGLMVPYVIVYVPLVTMFNKTGINGNLPSLIMVFVSGSISFSVFMYRGFIGSLSVELEEAAIVDSAGQFTIFFKIIMPLVKPCTTTVGIFIGLSMWNDFLTPLLIGQVKTITVGIYTAIGPYASDWGTVFAYVMFATLPIVVVYLFLQKQFIAGLTAGALKG